MPSASLLHLCEALLRELKHALKCRVMPKINKRFLSNDIFKILKASGISAVSLLDSMREDPDASFGLQAGTTSYFGPRQFPYTIAYLKTAKKYGLEVCAGGGVASKHDVEVLLSQGADLVQVASYILNRNYESTEDLLGSEFNTNSNSQILKHNPWCDVEDSVPCKNCGGCSTHCLPKSYATCKD